MIFFLNLDGTCTRQDTDHIYQGSNNVSKVIAITSIAPEQSHIGVAFTLPNGLTVGYLPMASKGVYNVEGNPLPMYLWTLDLPYNVTEMQGTVGVSFNVVTNITKENLIGINKTSYTNTFEVEYSALPTFDKPPTQDEWEQILNLLEAYAAVNPGIVEKLENFQIGTVTAQASESGAEPEVTAEIVNETTPNGYKLNMGFTLPRGAQGIPAGFGTITVEATKLPSDSEPTVEATATGSDEAKNFDFKFGIPQGEQGEAGEIALYSKVFIRYLELRKGETFVSEAENFNRTPITGEYFTAFGYKYTDDGLLNILFCHVSDASGSLTRCVLDNFYQISGTDGVNGVTPNISVTASVDNSVGTPSVTVTQSGTVEAPEINLAFHNLKGDKGDALSDVTGVKGSAETEYRQGNVNLTAEDVGAVPTTGGTYPNLTVGNATVAERFPKLSHLQQNFSNLLNNYFLIGTLPQMNSNLNGDEINLSGSIGAFLASQKQTIEITLSSRDSYIMTGITKLGADGVNYLNGIEFWAQSDGTVNVYFKTSADYMSVNLTAFASPNATVATLDDFVTPITAPTGTKVDYSNNVITLISSDWGNNDKVRIQPGSIDMFSPIADIASTSLPSDTFPNFSVYDKNGEWYSTFRGVQHAGGTVSTQLAVHRVVNGEHAERGVQIRLEPNGYSSFWPGWGDTDLGASWSNNRWKNIYHSGFIDKFRYATLIHDEHYVSTGIHSYNKGPGSTTTASQITFIMGYGGLFKVMTLPYSEWMQVKTWQLGGEGAYINFSAVSENDIMSDTKINIIDASSYTVFDIIVQ